MAKNLITLLLFAAFLGCWVAVECKKLSAFGLNGDVDLSEDEDIDEDDENGEEWTKFKGKRGKKFKGGEEDEKKNNFNENLKRVAEQNKKFLEHGSSFKTRVHAFSDWSLDDIKKKLHGSDKKPDESEVERKPSEGRNHKHKFHPDGPGKRRRRSSDPWPAVDYRDYGYVTPVKNQGQCGCCWALSAAAVLEGQLYGYYGTLVDISPQNLIDCSKSGNYGCNGGWPMNALNWVKSNGGIMKTSQYAFRAVDTQACKYNRAYKTPNLQVVQGHYLPAGDEEALKQALWDNGPIAVAINADSWDFINYSWGVFSDPSCSQEVNHAVLIVGYGHDDYSGQDYWLVKNSWGTDWGDNGYIKMARNQRNMCGIASWGQYPEIY